MLEGIVVKNVASIRRSPSANSEQVSQTIMGQVVRILQDEGDWLYIETADAYNGWIRRTCLRSNLHRTLPLAEVTELFTDAYIQPTQGSEIVTKLVITSVVEVLDQYQGFTQVQLPDGQQAWVRSSDIFIGKTNEGTAYIQHDVVSVVRTAKRFLGIPYIWGGTTPFGLDCSGFVQLVWKLHGILLPRDAALQTKDPRLLPVTDNGMNAGDLVFFASEKHNPHVNHVALAIDSDRIIHSAYDRGVAINRLDEELFTRSLTGVGRIE